GSARLWAVAAAAGVLLMTGPWASSANLVGVGFALIAGLCWGAYILLTQRAGDAVEGVQALAISMPVAALVATIIVGPSTFGRLSWSVMASGIGLALLMPVIPFTLELLALRRLQTAAFGILMSVEPAIALLIGVVLLGQVPQLTAALGVLLVVSAGVGAARSGARDKANEPVSNEVELIDQAVR
ncbi:MAG: EamA family transporter, partial [Actinomycetota bacterium]|nr:EamA family transporter [Actinomycetota bacterium]